MAKLVIIGSGAGGLPVASALKKQGADYDITVFTRDSRAGFSHCGIPFVFGREIASFDDLLMRSMEYYADLGIKIRTGVEVTRIDTGSNRVFADGTETGYDYLVIATGTAQSIPRIEGIKLGGVFPAHTKNLEAARELEEFLSSHEIRNAVILGSDSIDLEMAVAFSKRGIKVTVVEELHVLSSWLDADMADIVRKHLEALGIRVVEGKKVSRIKGSSGKVTSVELENEYIKADAVLLGTSFKPDVRLAMEDGIEVSGHGIVIDEACRVKKSGSVVSNVFASGACAQTINLVTGKPDFFYQASSSIKKSEVIAGRLLGRKSMLKPLVNPVVTVLGGLYAGAAGINSMKAKAHGISVIAGRAKSTGASRYYPGSEALFLKLLFNKASKRLIGAQVISGQRGVKERVDALGMAIRCGLTYEDMAALETSYSPPAGRLKDVMTEAAQNVGENENETVSIHAGE